MMVLGLEELEKIFTIYHGGNEDIFRSASIIRDQKSEIPTLKKDALFFTCYDDSVYESVLDDMKKEFGKLTRDKKKWLFA